MKFHVNSHDLIRELESVYPERLASPTDSTEVIQRHAGAREVVLLLRDLAAKALRPPPIATPPKRLR